MESHGCCCHLNMPVTQFGIPLAHPCPHGPRWLLELGYCAEIPAVREKVGGMFSPSGTLTPRSSSDHFPSRTLAQNLVTWSHQKPGTCSLYSRGHALTLGVSIRRRGDGLLGHHRHFETAPTTTQSASGRHWCFGGKWHQGEAGLWQASRHHGHRACGSQL